jgi:hypothetical protein
MDVKQSGYVLAGFETLATILDNFIEGRRGRFNDNFTRSDISNFLSKTTAGFLHSFGQDFGGKKKFDKYKQKEGDLYRKCREWGIFDNCNLIADSGGFQISIGRLTRDESNLLYKLYYEWLVEYADVYDKAFILDIPPGPGCKIFDNFDDVYRLNLESYEKAKTMPDHVRDKIIYVHHFRTPKLWEIYTKLLRDHDMFRHFKYHGTGGIVANMSSDMSIPCVIYILPIVPLVNEAKRYGFKHLNFHILGGANFRDVLFYELFSIVIKKKHDIDLNITYDSSGIYKQVMHARFMHVADEYGYIRKMSIKSDRLDMRFLKDLSTHDMTQRVFDRLAEKWNFKKIDVGGMYDPARNTFWEDVKVYSILYTLDLYTEIQQGMREFAERVYPIYESGDEEEFYRECLEATRILNQGKLTRKQKVKAHSIPRSLNVLASLDEDYCHYLIKKYLSKDEFIELDDKSRVLTLHE